MNKPKNCLEYLLNLYDKGIKLTILYNSNHCIGVTKNGIYERSTNQFKNELLDGELQSSPLKYLNMKAHYSYEQIQSTFELNEHYTQILKKYYGKEETARIY